MRPFSQSDGHDDPWLRGESLPVVAALRDDVVVVAKDAVGQPVVTHGLPDVFRDVQFGTFGWQRQRRDVGGYVERGRAMPPSLIEEQDGMLAWLTIRLISARCWLMPAVLQNGRTRAAPLPSRGQTAPKDLGGGRALILRC